MKPPIWLGLAGLGLTLVFATAAAAQTPAPQEAAGQKPAAQAAGGQSPVEMKSTTPTPPRPFEIITPGPASREASRVPDADFYREDQRVPYDPALIEPFVGTTKGGAKYGASAWTSPETPVGSLASQGYRQNNGWFGFGITFIWDTPAPPAHRPASAPAPAAAPR